MKKLITLILIVIMITPVFAIASYAGAWDGKTASESLKGEGTAASPYLVESAADLAFLAKSVNAGTTYEGKYITQTADIDLGSKEWTPIGICSEDSKKLVPFSGVYDGKDHKVTGLRINGALTVDTGLFGFISSTSKNSAGVANLSVSGEIKINAPRSVGIGGIIGRICLEADVGLSEIYVINCTSDVDITLTNCKNQPRVGGVIGYANLSTVQNVISNGDITINTSATSRVAGVFGEITSSTAKHCVNNGNITATATGGNAQVGGISGMSVYWPKSGRTLVFDTCINNGDVSSTLTTGKCYTGGIVGGFYSDDKKAMDILVVDCVNTGKIYSSASTGSSYYPYTGGIYSYASYPKTAIVRCVNIGEIVSIGGLDTRPGDIISVMNKPGEATIYCRDCICVNSLSAYIVNDKTGCVDKADPELVAAAAKSLADSVTFAYIDINGFDTSRSFSAAPIETFPLQTSKPHNISDAMNSPNGGTSDADENNVDEGAYKVIAVVALSISAVCSVGIVIARVVRRKKK